jgi:hypothetical protein
MLVVLPAEGVLQRQRWLRRLRPLYEAVNQGRFSDTWGRFYKKLSDKFSH